MAEHAEQTGTVISEEEVQALLDRAGPAVPQRGEARPYDLAGSQRITRGRLPTLELLHEAFARQFRGHLGEMIKRDLHVTFEGVQSVKCMDYLSQLPSPACLDLARARPLPGQVMFAVDPALILQMVDAFYGGAGRPLPREADRGLTPTESRFARLVVRQVASDLAVAWKPVAALDFELVKQERNAHFVDIAAPADTLLVNRFRIEMATGGGAIDFVLPAGSVEPLREVLASNASVRQAAGSPPWADGFAAALAGAQVEVRAVLAEAEISLRELVRLRPGDVVPIEAPSEAQLMAGDVPLYTARFGVSRGRNAVTVSGTAPRGRDDR